MRIHIAGLGPGHPGLLTVEVRELLASGLPVILRTRHHPTVEDLAFGGTVSDCDDLYAGARDFEAAYRAAAERVVAAARQGEMIYAVPGHPLVAERSVQEVLARARDEGLPATVYPGVSFVDAALAALGVDGGTLQVCDALDLRVDTWRPALIGQVYGREVAAEVKLKLLAWYPGEHRVVVLAGLGTAGERLAEVPLAELDHRPFGYLDAVFVPPLGPVGDVRRFDGLDYVVRRLNGPGGCPWDREQTHASLRPHLLEEAYEALEAIDRGDAVALEEELGDLLLQVLMHAAVAERDEEFELADVIEHIARKLIRRHPHVFGDATASSAEEVYRNWEALKQAEKPRESILDGVPRTLPALAASQAIQGRARRVGFDWPDVGGPLEKLAEELAELARAGDGAGKEEEFGDILFTVVNVADRLGIDAEQALRSANEKFRRRFGGIERLARERGVDLRELDLAGLDRLWEEVKGLEGGVETAQEGA
ncbi:nucleoside triphosphate pyrophosphohydrolase [Tepidiforma sp.]|uniref:nucleoside triphosphate pyrophosphohydrolase n=1 Tax=Tepidiforma sp. TaxID=2682230 RepID=UPI002ADDF431|nr:nucleoside triphosphate pyrophosphohydrolase [Tepidiforma sp.]